MTTEDHTSRGINNWREAFWTVVILSWIVVGLAPYVGIDTISGDVFLNGAQVIIIGMMFHVVALHFQPYRIGRFP